MNIHETAIVDSGATVGNGSKIWHWAHVSSGARVGENCSLGQNVFIGRNVRVGNGVKIQNNVSVFEGVVLKDEVFCGPSMVFTNVINPRAFVERKDEFRETIVGKGASLGANCTVLCGKNIGQYALVGAGAVVIEDVPDFAVVVGNPSRQVSWVNKYGEKLDLPLCGSAEIVSKGDRYLLEGEKLRVVSNG